MMFVNQMAAPLPSRSVALIPWMPFRMSTISTTTPPMVPAVMIAISTIVDRRAARERRSILPGSRMITTTNKTNSSTGNSHHPGTLRGDGVPTWSRIATKTASAMGQRGSARVATGTSAPMSPGCPSSPIVAAPLTRRHATPLNQGSDRHSAGLEEFDDVTRGIFQQDLGTARTLDDLVAEVQASGPEALHLPLEVVNHEVDFRFRHPGPAASRQASAAPPSSGDHSTASAGRRERRRECGSLTRQQGESEVRGVEGDGLIHVLNHVANVHRGQFDSPRGRRVGRWYPGSRIRSRRGRRDFRPTELCDLGRMRIGREPLCPRLRTRYG